MLTEAEKKELMEMGEAWGRMPAMEGYYLALAHCFIRNCKEFDEAIAARLQASSNYSRPTVSFALQKHESLKTTAADLISGLECFGWRCIASEDELAYGKRRKFVFEHPFIGTVCLDIEVEASELCHIEVESKKELKEVETIISRRLVCDDEPLADPIPTDANQEPSQ